MTITRSDLRVSVLESIHAVDEGRWQALTEAADAPAFYSHAFLRSVEARPLTDGARAVYLVAHRGNGDLSAALPLYLQHTRDPFDSGPDRGPMRMLIGHVWHCYDTTLVSTDAVTPDLVAAFWSQLRELATDLRADLWGLANVALTGHLADALRQLELPVEPTAPRYRLPLHGGPSTLDEHLAGIGRASRRTLRAYVRRARRAGAVISLTEGRDGLDDDVLRLCLATANKRAPGYYPPDRLGALITELGPACAILRVELDGRLLAASICLFDRSRMHTWAGGCEYPAELNWSPQYVLFAAELEAGIRSGRAVLECGRRNDEFKLRHGLRPYPLARTVQRSGAVP